MQSDCAINSLVPPRVQTCKQSLERKMLAVKRAESRSRYYTRDEARRLGWDVRHPSEGGRFLEEQEVVDFLPRLQKVFGFGTACIQPWRFCACGSAGSAVRILKPRFAMTLSELMWFSGQINEERWRIFYARMASATRLRRYRLEPPPDDLPPVSGLNNRLLQFRKELEKFCTTTPDSFRNKKAG